MRRGDGEFSLDDLRQTYLGDICRWSHRPAAGPMGLEFKSRPG